METVSQKIDIIVNSPDYFLLFKQNILSIFIFFTLSYPPSARAGGGGDPRYDPLTRWNI